MSGNEFPSPARSAEDWERLSARLAAAESRLAQLRDSQADAAQAAARMEATAMLAGGIAHDFNNLMVGVLGNAALVRAGLPEGHASVPLLRSIEESAGRAADLARQTVAFACRGGYEFQSVSLNDFVLRAVHLHEEVEPGDFRVERNLDPNLWRVHADPTQLSQVVTTLYTRALEAMRGQGLITLTTRNLQLRREDSLSSFHDAIHPGRYAYLAGEYALPGPGAAGAPARESHRLVFSTRFQNQAAGLGLVYGIVKNHQGRLFLDAEPGSPRALFRLYLPAAPEGAEGAAPGPAADALDTEAHLPVGAETILVADDEPVVLSVTQAILEKLGYKVLLAHDGHEAVEVVGMYNGPIDLVILDLAMPQMGGREAFPILKRARPGTKIVISSGYDENNVAQDLLAAGADAYIQKPFALGEFAPTIREVLDRPGKP